MGASRKNFAVGARITEVRNAFRVAQTVDEYGREGGTVGYFDTQKEAENAADGQGWWGGKGVVREVVAAVLDNGKVLILADPGLVELGVNQIIKHNALRENARKKLEDALTPGEIAALGIELDK